MKYDVIVVGAGIAGLTSAAHLTKYGYKVLLCEQATKVGGLVNTFEYNGFKVDGGIRAIENSGVVFPMLKNLGIDIEFTKNVIMVAIEDQKIKIEGKESLHEYQQFLSALYPQNINDITLIIHEIKQIMKYMEVLYGIDNPLFVDYKNDYKYLFGTILPWLFKYMKTIGKIEKLNQPVENYLLQFTDNKSLIDIIAQHFFQKTPTFFALSYFSLYLDYQYPLGGTGVLTEKLADYIQSNHGQIETGLKIDKIDILNKFVVCNDNRVFEFESLIWASDGNELYKSVVINDDLPDKVINEYTRKKDILESKKGNDSILTTYIFLDEDVETLGELMTAHVFYTPSKKGLSPFELEPYLLKVNKRISDLTRLEIIDWLDSYLDYNTFEISCPALRDKSMAPDRKSALIVSVLFDYELTKHIQEMGFYEEFKKIIEKKMIELVVVRFLKISQSKVLTSFSSTPLTLKRYTGNFQGAITGWSFTNSPIPTVTKLSKIGLAVQTNLPNIYQAGHWTFSPSGLPTAIITGKLAADAINKKR